MKTIAIIGAGPAGTSAAYALKQAGFRVIVFESEPAPLHNIGNKSLLFPTFEDAERLKDQLAGRLTGLGTDLRLGHKVYDISPLKEGGWTIDGEKADAVLIATGYDLFDARQKEELGYGIYKNVCTSIELESMLKQKVILNEMGIQPKRIVFLQCVGSRDEKTGNNYCSKICCITAVKQAIEAKRLAPEAEVYVMYMDLRMAGQHYEELYRSAQEKYGIRFIRGRISEVSSTFDGRLQVKAEDTLLGRPMKMTADLLVLMVGMRPSHGTCRLGEGCSISGEYGFINTSDPFVRDNETARKGLFAAGSCKRPMAIPDAISDGLSAAATITDYLTTIH